MGRQGGVIAVEIHLIAAEFCIKHDLLLVSDEIHHDLTFGAKHTAMALIDGISDRLIMMTAASKTFNIAGGHSGNVIIEDPNLRARFAKRMQALGLSPNSFGLHMITAAYSPEGAQWVDELLVYLDGNRKIFDAGINAIPGLTSMHLEATYLAWVDVSGTGMSLQEAIDRVQKRAKIAVNHGPTFGTGGESFLRFNIGTQRANVERAVAAMQEAFSDLQ
jgi:cystathionine beta-lyase